MIVLKYMYVCMEIWFYENVSSYLFAMNNNTFCLAFCHERKDI